MVDELKTLSQDLRTLARQQMLQALLVGGCRLAIHRETKNLAIYTLVIAKNGPKVQEAKPVETTSPGFGGQAGNAIDHRTGWGRCESRVGVVSGPRQVPL